MYLKVYYHGDDIATPELVRAYLQQDMPGLEVLDTRIYPMVEFPENCTYSEYRRVQEFLESCGFETESW